MTIKYDPSDAGSILSAYIHFVSPKVGRVATFKEVGETAKVDRNPVSAFKKVKDYLNTEKLQGKSLEAAIELRRKASNLFRKSMPFVLSIYKSKDHPYKEGLLYHLVGNCSKLNDFSDISSIDALFRSQNLSEFAFLENIEANDWKDRYDACQLEVDKLISENGDLTAMLDALKADLDQTRSERDTLISEKEALTLAVQNLTADVERLTSDQDSGNLQGKKGSSS